MASRRKAREYALQMLFQWELTKAEPKRIESTFWKASHASSETQFLANSLFEGASADTLSVDELIISHSENWRLERMATIDRNILRLAAHELRRGEAPPKVIINEAIELAKKFSDANAVGFVNGVLDAIHKSLCGTSAEQSPQKAD